MNPSPLNSAADLDGDNTRRNNAIAAGMARNYFVVNPDVAGNSVTDSGAFSDYHALQIDLRRRLSQGLSANINYQYAREGGSAFDGFLHGRTMVMNGDGVVRHAIKTQWDWTIPVGRGQRYMTDANAWVDAFLGGWSFKGVGRFQALARDFGNVNLVGMTHDELQSLYKPNVKVDPGVHGRPAARLLLPGRHHPQHPAGVRSEHRARRMATAPSVLRRAVTSRRPTQPPVSRWFPATARRAH